MTIKQNPVTGELSASHPVKSDWLTKRANGDLPLPQVNRPDTLAPGYAEHWQREAGSDDPTLNNLGALHTELARSFQAFAEIRENRPPSLTQAVHLQNLARDFDTTTTRLASATDRAKEAAAKRLAKIEDEFRSAVRWSEKDSSELRAVFRGMSASEKSEFVSEAIASKDGQALGAILGGHFSMTGLTREQQRAYRQRALMEARPDLARLEKTLQTAVDTVSNGFRDLLERGETLTAAAVRKQYQQQAEKAEKARAGLNTSIV